MIGDIEERFSEKTSFSLYLCCKAPFHSLGASVRPFTITMTDSLVNEVCSAILHLLNSFQSTHCRQQVMILKYLELIG